MVSVVRRLQRWKSLGEIQNRKYIILRVWSVEKKGIDFTMAMIHAWLFSGYTGTHEDGMQALSRLDHKKYQEVM